MRFSLEFISEFFDVKVSPQELAKTLTMAGMEVESLSQEGGDWVFDIEVTTNRYDWLSVVGISREAAAVLGRHLKIKPPKIKKTPNLKERNIIIQDKNDCPFYTGRSIRGVDVKAAPDSIKNKVLNCGLASVNDVVDITNYCMLKWGNPLHAFDDDKLQGDIHIRRAKKGESFVGIDGKERALDKENLVIADSKKVVALAGVMGSKDTEVDEQTKNIFLEAAVFSPLTVRRSRRLAGVDTESSYRFERKVNPDHLEYASQQACSLIENFCRGTFCGYKEAGKKPGIKSKKINLRLDHLASYLGADFPRSEIKKALKGLDFAVQDISANTLVVSSPTHRFDIESEIDIYEEFARIYGYEKIPAQIPFLTSYPKSNLSISKEKGLYYLKNDLRSFMSLSGFKEIVTFSIENKKDLTFLDDKEPVDLINPLKKTEGSMRTTLSLGMIESLRHNLNRNAYDLHFFEVADIYFRDKNTFKEIPSLSLGISGKAEDFFLLKETVEKLIKHLNISQYSFRENTYKGFSSSLDLVIAGKPAGFLGKLDEKDKDRSDLRQDLFFAQLDVSVLEKCAGRKKFTPFSPYPAISRDISLALKKNIKFKTVEETIRSISTDLADLRIVDTYQGKDVPKDTGVFTLRLFYQSRDKTLTSNEVDSFHQKIREKLDKSDGITLR